MPAHAWLRGGLCLALTAITVTAKAQAPHVVSRVPSQNQLNVSQSTDIFVAFDTDINSATLTSANIVVAGSLSGSHATTCSYNAGLRMATIMPSTDFLAGEVSTVILTTGIRSTAGTALSKSHIWQFTIAATQGSGTFLDHVDFDAGDSTYGLAAGDFTGDGRLDLVAANSGSNDITILPALGGGMFAVGMNYSVGSRPRSVCLADLDQDGDLDIATANQWSNSVSVLRNSGAGLVTSNVAYACGSQPRSVTAGDLDGDGDYDLITANSTADSVSVLFNSGTGTFATRADYATTDMPVSVALGDFDNDNDLDVVSACWGGSGILAILYNTGSGAFGTPVLAGYGGPISAAAADINGDAWLDIIGAGNGPDAANISLNLGNGTFNHSADHQYPVASYPNMVATCDLNHDGDLDLAFACSYQELGWRTTTLNNDGLAAFSGRVDRNVDYGPWAMVAADLDGDGSMDLATGNIAAGTVSVLMNTCCGGSTGNVDADAGDLVDISDLSSMVDYLFFSGTISSCFAECDVDGSGSIDISDLQALIDFLFFSVDLPSC